LRFWPKEPSAPVQQSRKRSRTQQLIRDLADEEFSDGWTDITTTTIVERVGQRWKTKLVPSRDTVERALDRRKK
jgi:hypothetical protein